MWLPLALTAAFLTSFLPIINKRLLADADVPVVAWGVNALSLPLLALASVLACLSINGRSKSDISPVEPNATRGGFDGAECWASWAR